MRKIDAVAPSSKSSETPSASLPSNNIIPDTTYDYNLNTEKQKHFATPHGNMMLIPGEVYQGRMQTADQY